MMTRDLLLEQMRMSEANEEKTYLSLTRSLFDQIQNPLKLLYDDTATVTDRFTRISPEVIRANPKIIKTLRYCLAPVVSQMRLGQLIGVDTTEAFEEKGRAPTDGQVTQLAAWVNGHLDRNRFQWLDRPRMSAAERGLSETYAKLWTVSLQSNQNSATQYRTRRKEMQEAAIMAALGASGLALQETLGIVGPPRARRKAGDPPFSKPSRLGGINDAEDVRPGHYVREKKILAGSQKRQKADAIVRPSRDPRLYCIEAKAVGIRLDSTKRLKELNDKHTDWMGVASLALTTVGVVAGMFRDVELIATIKRRPIPIFFEHDLSRLTEFLLTGLYYGAPWIPALLFPEMPEHEIVEAIEKIQTPDAEGAPPAEDAGPDEPR